MTNANEQMRCKELTISEVKISVSLCEKLIISVQQLHFA